MRQRVLVTGTSSGLGPDWRRPGYAVVASMRTLAKSNALRAELDRRKTTAEVLELDVTSPDSVTNAIAHLEATGGLDVLINNAGVQGQGFLECLDDETFKRNVVLGLMRNPAPPFRTRTSDDVRRVYRLWRLLPFSAFVRCSGARRFLISRK
jgi:NAD(P)-dependent dehydrogenase (short-subunit alcohol dehydrogenase family)